jgi:DNA polymerase-3 subunit epsilon
LCRLRNNSFLQQGGKIIEVGIVGLNLEAGNKILFNEVCTERPITLKERFKSWIVNNSSSMTVEEIRN